MMQTNHVDGKRISNKISCKKFRLETYVRQNFNISLLSKKLQQGVKFRLYLTIFRTFFGTRSSKMTELFRKL